MAISPINGSYATAADTSATAGSAPSSTARPSITTGAEPTKEMFLKLLVAQIKNQDPLNPTDGVQFLSQLAQFSELEQLMSIRQGIDTISTAATTPSDGGGTEQTTTTP